MLRLARREGKLSPKAWGPYTFIKYAGPTRTTAEVQEAASGKIVTVSVAHLRPMHPERAQRMKRYPLPLERPDEEPSHTSEDLELSESSSSAGEVVEVVPRKRVCTG